MLRDSHFVEEHLSYRLLGYSQQASSDGVAWLGILKRQVACLVDPTEWLVIFTICEYTYAYAYGYLSLGTVAFMFRATHSARSKAAMCQAKGWRIS